MYYLFIVYCIYYLWEICYNFIEYMEFIFVRDGGIFVKSGIGLSR